MIRVILAAALLAVSAVSGAAITWGPCPAGEGGNDCALVPRALDPSNPSGPTVNSFVRRFYAAGAPPPQDSLWMISGGPGDSGNSFSGGAAFLTQLNPAWTVYVIDQRGIGRSSMCTCASPPPYTEFDPYNETIVASFRACNADLAAKYASTAAFYATYYGALDLAALIADINPRRVAIYALSYGTYFTNTYLQLPTARADVVVLDGPVPPNRWMLENNAQWVSHVAYDLLRMCGAYSATCAALLGEQGHMPRLAMDAVIDGSLPCLAQLPWLNQHTAAAHTRYLMTHDDTRGLVGNFWWRLLRCSAADVAELNFFNALRDAETAAAVAAATAAGPTFDYAYGMAVLVAANEVYSLAGDAAALTYAQQVLLTSRLMADAGVQFVISLARDATGGTGNSSAPNAAVPRYDPYTAPTYGKFAAPKVPVLILVGDLDTNTPHGNGPWLASGLGSRAHFVTVPFALHGTLSATDACVADIVVSFLRTLGQPPNTACLAQHQPPDFDGVTATGLAALQHYFNSTSAWRVPSAPTPTAPTPTPTAAPSGGKGSKSGVVAGGIIAAIVAAIIVVTALYLYRKRSHTDAAAFAADDRNLNAALVPREFSSAR